MVASASRDLEIWLRDFVQDDAWLVAPPPEACRDILNN